MPEVCGDASVNIPTAHALCDSMSAMWGIMSDPAYMKKLTVAQHAGFASGHPSSFGLLTFQQIIPFLWSTVTPVVSLSWLCVWCVYVMHVCISVSRCVCMCIVCEHVCCLCTCVLTVCQCMCTCACVCECAHVHTQSEVAGRPLIWVRVNTVVRLHVHANTTQNCLMLHFSWVPCNSAVQGCPCTLKPQVHIVDFPCCSDAHL